MADELGTTLVAQVGLVVHDVEAKARAWSDLFGLPMPEIRMTDPSDVTHAQYRGQPTTGRAKLAFFDMGNVQVELIEPVGSPSTWQEQLDKHGDSVHHLAFRVGTVDQMMAKLPGLEAQGLELVQRGDWRPNGRYLYLDAVAKLGLILELLPG